MFHQPQALALRVKQDKRERAILSISPSKERTLFPSHEHLRDDEHAIHDLLSAICSDGTGMCLREPNAFPSPHRTIHSSNFGV